MNHGADDRELQMNNSYRDMKFIKRGYIEKIELLIHGNSGIDTGK